MIFFKDEDGVTAVEYGMILSVFSLPVAYIFGTFGVKFYEVAEVISTTLSV